MAIFDLIGPWVSLAFILSIWSFALVKPNKLSDIAVATFVAGAYANILANAYWSVVQKAITPLLEGKVSLIIPLVLGVGIITTLTKEYRYISRWGLAVIAGTATGLAIRGIVETGVVKQLAATILPITGVPLTTAINNIIVIVSVVSVLSYFQFSGRIGSSQDTKVQLLRKLARSLIMVLLAVAFAKYTVMRINLIYGRLTELYTTLGILK